MSSSILSSGAYFDPYDIYAKLQSINENASTDNSSASNTALSISNVLKESEDSAAAPPPIPTVPPAPR